MNEEEFSLGDDGGGGTGVHQQEANVEGTHQLWKQEKAVAIRVKVEATATPDYPEFPPPPHLADPPQPPVQVRPPGLLRLNSQRGSLRIVPFYNKKFLNIQLPPLYTYPDSLFNIPFISSLTPTLHLIDFDFFQWIFVFFQPPEPDSYPTHETPLCTAEGPTTINVVERRKMKKKNE